MPEDALSKEPTQHDYTDTMRLEALPALADPADLAPRIGMTAEALQADSVKLARAQEALDEASDNVRDAAGGRTFVVAGDVDVPRAVRNVVLAAARRAFLLYGT